MSGYNDLLIAYSEIDHANQQTIHTYSSRPKESRLSIQRYNIWNVENERSE